MLLKKVFGFAFCLLAGAALAQGAQGGSLVASNLVLQDLDYTDHLQTLPNYDRGFYRPQVLHLKPSGTKPVEKPYGKLLHLRAEISEFSSRAWLSVDTTGGRRDTTWGKSQDLTEDALNVLQTSFDNIRSYDGKVIVRICYDPWYNGRSNVTPEHKWVLRHVEQLAPVLSKNTDVIMALEMGMHGAYGEMHSDTSITYPRVAEAANLMLRLTPPELKILTRTGNYSAAVLGFENWGVDFNIDSDVFKRIAEAKGDTMFRVGMFNDGYLGTQYDYGTWGSNCATSICREEGVAWLEKYSINTPYGGEALTTASGYQVINTPEFLAYEGFRTHTSYLNIEWNYNLINDWKAAHFAGKDYEYDGYKIDTLTGFKYIEDHLGYRFVLRESWLPDTVGTSRTLRAKLKIQNVGFGNLTHEMKTSLVLKWEAPEWSCPYTDPLIDCTQPVLYGQTLYQEIPLDSVIDFRNVHSRTITVNGGDTITTFDGTNDLCIVATLKNVSEMPNGEWKAFLKIVNSGDSVNQSIHFANDPKYFESSSVGNYIGSFVYDSQKTESIGVAPALRGGGIRGEAKLQTRVERADQKIQVRDGRSRSNALGKNRDGSGDKLFRVNGVSVH